MTNAASFVFFWVLLLVEKYYKVPYVVIHLFDTYVNKRFKIFHIYISKVRSVEH